jgi:hypothetical protein
LFERRLAPYQFFCFTYSPPSTSRKPQTSLRPDKHCLRTAKSIPDCLIIMSHSHTIDVSQLPSIMNWTGGRLSRHSRKAADSSVKQQQKAHFAKVRSRLQNAPTTRSPPLRHGPFDELHYKEPIHSQAGKRERWSPPSENVRDGVTKNTGESLEAIRKRLLRLDDWVLAGVQHPIKLKYPHKEHEERLGKRRRISGTQSHLRATVQPMIESPFPVSRTRPGIQDRLVATHVTEPSNHVRISIGGRQMPVGVSSHTSQSRLPRHATMSSQASASDIMLLDAENGSRPSDPLQYDAGRQDHNEIYPTFPNPTVARASGLPPRSSPSFGYNHWKYTPHCKRKSSPADSRNLHGRSFGPRIFYNGRRAANTPPVKHRLPLPGPSIYSKSSDRTSPNRRTDNVLTPLRDEYITSISSQLSESARKLQSVTRDKARKRRRSSGPELLHPKPQSSKVPNVLVPTSSEADDSVIAQIGTQRQTLAGTQLADEEIWKSWVELSERDDKQEDFLEDCLSKFSISPGISHRHLQGVEEDSESPREHDSSSEPPSQRRSIDAGTENLPEHRQSQERQDDPAEESGRQEGSIYGETPTTHPVINYKSLFVSRRDHIVPPPPPKAFQKKNSDEAWLKFVLSDNNEEHDEIAAVKALSPVYTAPRVPGSQLSSSLFAHGSRETTPNTQSLVPYNQFLERSPQSSYIESRNHEVGSPPQGPRIKLRGPRPLPAIEPSPSSYGRSRLSGGQNQPRYAHARRRVTGTQFSHTSRPDAGLSDDTFVSNRTTCGSHVSSSSSSQYTYSLPRQPRPALRSSPIQQPSRNAAHSKAPQSIAHVKRAYDNASVIVEGLQDVVPRSPQKACRSRDIYSIPSSDD